MLEMRLNKKLKDTETEQSIGVEMWSLSVKLPEVAVKERGFTLGAD